jgi:hypothetical protein
MLGSRCSIRRTLPGLHATTGNRAVAESKNLWREPTLGILVKRSLLRDKKILGKDQNSRRRNSSSRAKKTLGEEFFAESFFLSAKKFKKSFFRLHTFLSLTCTYTKYMFKFDVILSMFAIFKIFTSF